MHRHNLHRPKLQNPCIFTDLSIPFASTERKPAADLCRFSDPKGYSDGVTPCRYGAPTVLVVAFDSGNVFTYPGDKRDSGVEDATIVATHMILAAADAGVDSCWVNFFDPEKMAEALGLPENEEVLMIMDLGYAAEGVGPLPNHGNRKELDKTVCYL